MNVRILVVDDDPDALLLIRLVLRRPGWEVVTATGGAEALRAADQYVPELILLDLMLPGMSGYELCSRLRADPRFQQTPILAFTAMTRRRETDLARQAGANDVIVKPIQADELLNRVQSYLGPAGA